MITIVDTQESSTIDNKESIEVVKQIIEASIKQSLGYINPVDTLNSRSPINTQLKIQIVGKSYDIQSELQKRKMLIEAINSSIEKIKQDIQSEKQTYSERAFKRYPFTSSLSNHLSNEGLKITQKRLIELWQEEDDDEYGILRPTVDAFDKAWSLVNEAARLLQSSFRKAAVSTDEEGGIRLTWTRPEVEAEVRLICPCDQHKEVYLYHEQLAEYNIVKNVTGFNLASWLNWLNQV